MKVGVVTTSYPRESGDPAGSFVAGFNRWLADQGHDVEVVAAGPGAHQIDGIPVARVDGRGLFYAGGAPDALAAHPLAWSAAARFQIALAAAVAARAPAWQAVVSHWLVPSALAVEWHRSRSAQAIPHLAIAHSSDVALLRRLAIGRATIAWLSRRVDLVYSAPHLRLPRAPGRVVAMGIDPVAGGDRARGRQRFGLTRTTALFLGRLVPVKGLDRLLDDGLPKGLDLVVAGEGPLAGPLGERARPLGSQVRFVGEVRGEARRDLLAAVDLLIHPSIELRDGSGRGEGAPLAVREAIAAGKPVVTTSRCAQGIVTDEDNGLVVVDRGGAFRSALAHLLDEPGLLARVTAGACASAARLPLGWPEVGPRLAGRLLGASA